MDSALLHRFLDIGIALHTSIVPTQLELEDSGVGYIELTKDKLDEIIRAHIPWDDDDNHVLFNFVLDCIINGIGPPDAFSLAGFVHARYSERVEGKDDMAYFVPK